MSSKIIIIAVIILVVASLSVLFVVETKNHNYDYKKSWNVIYFENPRDESFDFAIENHEGLNVKYRYQILINEDKVIDGEVDIARGVTQKISPVLDGEKIKGSRVVIIVSYKENDYKIYKNLRK